MHLWPTTKLRDSFKESYLKKQLHWYHKQQQQPSSSEEKLLNPDDDISNQENQVGSIFCRDLLMIFSLCFCCGEGACL